MKKQILIIVLLFTFTLTHAQKVLMVGDTTNNIVLTNVNDRAYSLDAQNDIKGFILAFIAPNCEYCMLYENRIIALDDKYKTLGYPVIGISPYGDDSVKYPLDAMPAMKKWVAEKHIKFPYLADTQFKYSMLFGIKETPRVVILQKVKSGYVIKYIGKIDNDPTLKKAKIDKIAANKLDSLIK